MEAEREQVFRSKCFSKNCEEEQTARIGPGVMTSKEVQAVKKIPTRKIPNRKMKEGLAPMQNEEETCHLEGVKPGSLEEMSGWGGLGDCP